MRLIVLAGLIWLAWFMIRNYLKKQASLQQQARKRDATTSPAKPDKIVKCHYCEVHLPQQEALQHDSQWFCTPAHKQAFLADSSKS